MIVWGSAACRRRNPATRLREASQSYGFRKSRKKSEIYFLTGSAGQKILLSRKCAR